MAYEIPDQSLFSHIELFKAYIEHFGDYRVPHLTIDGVIVGLDSWRGAYSELMLELSTEKQGITTGQILDLLEKADGGTFSAYTSAEYTMDMNTPIWVDVFNECNFDRVMGFDAVGTIIVKDVAP